MKITLKSGDRVRILKCPCNSSSCYAIGWYGTVIEPGVECAFVAIDPKPPRTTTGEKMEIPYTHLVRLEDKFLDLGIGKHIPNKREG